MARASLGELWGLLNLNTGNSEDGDVVAVVHWEDPEDASVFINKFVDTEQAKSLTTMIEMEAFVMKSYELADHYDLA